MIRDGNRSANFRLLVYFEGDDPQAREPQIPIVVRLPREPEPGTTFTIGDHDFQVVRRDAGALAAVPLGHG